MKSRNKRWMAAAVAALLTASLFGSQASAMQYTGTGSYMSGKYYRELKQVKLTGDPRTDIVAIAKSQVGYQEGDSEDQLTGEIYGGVNFTEYGAWYGVQDMWCAMFASWCAHQAGVSTETVPSHCATPAGLNWFADRGLAYTREDVQARKYTPKPGDIVYFKSSRNAKPTNHVGIVTAYSDDWVYTVEGNVGQVGKTTGGGMVAERSYPITNTFIVYFCSPNYESGSTSVLPNAQEKEEKLRLESLRQALFAVETGDELTYDAVNTDPMGRVALGCGQWYGPQAAELLKQIQKSDPDGYALLDPMGVLLEAGTLTRITEDRVQILQNVLGSKAGILVQNAWMDRCLTQWTDHAAAQGVTDPDALLLCAALYQLRGAAAAEQVITRAGDVLTKDTLLNTIKDLEPGLYRTCCLLVE